MSIWKRKFKTEVRHQKQHPGRQRTLSTPFPSFNLAQDCLKRRRKYEKSKNIHKAQK